MKERGVAYRRPAAYEDIHMPKNSMVGVAMGAFAFVLGFAMIWQIWWLAAASGLAMWIAMIARSSDDDSEFKVTAAEVKRIEDARYRALATRTGSRK